MPRSRRPALLALVGAAVACALGSTAASGAPAAGGAPAAPGGAGHHTPASTAAEAPAAVPAALRRPCGTLARPARVRHVVWIWLENRSRDEVLGTPATAAAAPTIDHVARACGYAAGYRAVTHPSLPNYLAAVSGTTFGIARTCLPADCPVRGPSIMRQAERAGVDWRTYAESMPAPCTTTNVGRYVARHNPPVYFSGLRASCRTRALPLGSPRGGDFAHRLVTGRLPGFTLVVPDLCHSGHDCPLPVVDAWLARWLPLIVRSPGYRAGDTAVVVAWDEGSSGVPGHDCRADPVHSCQIAALVLSRSTPAGAVSRVPLDHYSLLRTTQEVLGLRPLLGAAAQARSMRAAFRL